MKEEEEEEVYGTHHTVPWVKEAAESFLSLAHPPSHIPSRRFWDDFGIIGEEGRVFDGTREKKMPGPRVTAIRNGKDLYWRTIIS